MVSSITSTTSKVVMPSILSLQKATLLDQDKSKAKERVQVREFLATQIAQKIFEQQVGQIDFLVDKILTPLLDNLSHSTNKPGLETKIIKIKELFSIYIKDIKPLFLSFYTSSILKHTDRTDLLHKRVYDKDTLEIELSIAKINMDGAVIMGNPDFLKSLMAFLKELTKKIATQQEEKHQIPQILKSTTPSSLNTSTPKKTTLQDSPLEGSFQLHDKLEFFTQLEKSKHLDLNPERAEERTQLRKLLATKIAKQVMGERMIYSCKTSELFDAIIKTIPSDSPKQDSIKDLFIKEFLIFFEEQHPIVLSNMITSILENTSRTDLLCMRAYDKDTLKIENTNAKIDSDLPKLMVEDLYTKQEKLNQQIAIILNKETETLSSSETQESSSYSLPSASLPSTSSQFPEISEQSPMISSLNKEPR